jgi:hypothetical protein
VRGSDSSRVGLYGLLTEPMAPEKSFYARVPRLSMSRRKSRNLVRACFEKTATSRPQQAARVNEATARGPETVKQRLGEINPKDASPIRSMGEPRRLFQGPVFAHRFSQDA